MCPNTGRHNVQSKGLVRIVNPFFAPHGLIIIARLVPNDVVRSGRGVRLNAFYINVVAQFIGQMSPDKSGQLQKLKRKG